MFFIFASLHGPNVKKQTWGPTGIQSALHTETEVCNSVAPGSARGLGCECTVSAAVEHTKNRNPFSSQFTSECLASLNPLPETFFFFFFFSSTEVSEGFHYSEASLWWDQAMFGHECGFGRTDLNEREWKLTGWNIWGWRADAVEGFGQTDAADVTVTPGVLVITAGALRKWTTVCMSVISYKGSTYVRAHILTERNFTM